MKCLFNKYCDINPIDEHLDKVPKILYKYRSFDLCGYSLRLASKGEVFFASASDFNDPFDNYFIPKSKFEDLKGDELDEFLRKKAKQHYPYESDDFIENKVKIGKERHQKLKKDKYQIMDDILQVQYGSFGICSLSANPKSLPLWAYYGDSHKGICIGISTSKLANQQRELLKSQRLLMLRKVIYRKKIPVINIDIKSDIESFDISEKELNEIEMTLYAKSVCWKHEEEYRLIFHDYTLKSFTFGSDAIEEIIVGYKASENNIKSLLNHLKINNSQAVIKKANRSLSKYEIIFD